jgi:hypothetical protein
VLSAKKLTFLVYGEDGIGKTSLIKTLPYKPEEILYVAADPGQLALAPNKHNSRDMRGVKFFKPTCGKDFHDIRDYIKSEAGKHFKIVVIDGLDEVGNESLKLLKEIERRKGSKANMQAAYGDMADYMLDWITVIKDANISSLFITHIEESEESDIRYTPSFPGKKAAGHLTEMFDEVLCLRIESKVPGAVPERLLQCTRNVGIRYKVKDRSGMLDDYEKPDLGVVFSKVFGPVK